MKGIADGTCSASLLASAEGGGGLGGLGSQFACTQAPKIPQRLYVRSVNNTSTLTATLGH